jgi:outer membrane protein TolC
MFPATLLTLLALQAAPVLTLDDALRQAEERSLDLVAARARLAQAKELARKAWSGYLPQLTASGAYTYNSDEARIALPTSYVVRDVGQPTSGPFDPGREPSPDNPPGMPTNYVSVPSGFVEAVIQRRHQLSGTVQLSQGLLVPALWAQLHSAYLAESTAELALETTRREVLFAVAQLYYGAEGLREAVEVQQRLLEANVKHEKDAELRHRTGTATKVVFLRAQMARSRSEQDLRRTRNAYAASLSALATVLDREPDFEVARPPVDTTRPPVRNVSTLGQSALEERPDLRAARQNVALVESSRGAVLARYAPSLALVARYTAANAAGFTGRYGTWTAGLVLNWTLWDGGLRESELREAHTRLQESRAELRKAQNKARDEVRQALLELESAEANRVKAEEEARLAQENSRLVRVSFEAGTTTSLEVVDAHTALLGAELTLIHEQLNAQLAALRLARAAGLFNPGGDSSPAAPPLNVRQTP